ncbi:MAG: septation protein SpoVG family protein [Patescibacteria group bacterium]|nr:SpoVG family protein [Patescibacteria group bacterium]
MKKPIKEIQIVPVKPNNGLVAFCSFTLFDSLYCGSIGVFTRPAGGYRLVYPTKLTGNREMNIFHPISKQIGQHIEQEVIKKLEEVMKDDRYSSSDNL